MRDGSLAGGVARENSANLSRIRGAGGCSRSSVTQLFHDFCVAVPGRRHECEGGRIGSPTQLLLRPHRAMIRAGHGLLRDRRRDRVSRSVLIICVSQYGDRRPPGSSLCSSCVAGR